MKIKIIETYECKVIESEVNRFLADVIAISIVVYQPNAGYPR